MSKRLLSVVVLTFAAYLICNGAPDGKKNYTTITYGIEWSYVESFSSFIHQNFYSQEGSRVDIKRSALFHKSEAEVYLHLGANLNKYWNLALYAGCTRIVHTHYAIPISLRLTRFFRPDPMGDRGISFIEAGSGPAFTKVPSPLFSARIGGGYRFSLNRKTKIDLIASYRLLYSQSQINYFGEIISHEAIMRNTGLYSAITIGVNITL